MRMLALVVSMLATVAVAGEERPARSVTLRVKDADVRDVIQSLKKQCGIRNVVIDDDVSGRASFYLSGVPCSTAWSVVLKTYGLAATSYSETIVHVEGRR